MVYFAVAWVASAVFEFLALDLALELFVAGKFFFLETAAASLDTHLQALDCFESHFCL